MIWEYLAVGAVLVLALVYLWKVFVRQKGCSCASCPGGQSTDCGTCPGQELLLDDFRKKDPDSGHEEK
ncbi:MAG: hypothetical protein ACLFP9_09190 [Desulfonatronovibrio sp.]